MKKFIVVVVCFVFSCSATVEKAVEKPVVEERREEDVYKERIRQDFMEFLRRAKERGQVGR